ncbi:MAG: acetoacetyl-CoA reductase [Gammaproteobacteria bacterium]|jgi:acetoacetyl-CoA reductase
MTRRVAVVTGGVGDLGRAIVERLLSDGVCVGVLDINAADERARQWAAALNNVAGRLLVLPADVGDFESCAHSINAIAETLGPIDILINCAGITRDGTLRKMSKEQWDAVLGVNLDSVFHTSRHVIEGMISRGFGRIVNIASVNGVKGQFGQTNYSSAKAGMHGFTMALAQEVASKGITVNSVSPGYMNTALVRQVPADVLENIIGQIPVGRLGEPREIAAMVGFLVSNDASFVTGANFNVNGGLHMH